jgi:hypothetical protein
MKENWYDAATLLVTQSVEREIPLDPSLKTQALGLKRKLEKFVSAIENSSSVQVVSPAYQWAQSPTKIFLDIKFSHRLDSPGCLEVRDPVVTITDTKLNFYANCARSTQRIRLELDLEYYAEVVPEESNYSFTSVGRLNVNLQKKTDETVWPKPMKGKKPNNVHTWWEMKEKYQKVMDMLGDYDETADSDSKPPEILVDKDL